MDTHSFNGRKTASTAALYICGWSKFVIRFICGDDLILPAPFQVILGPCIFILCRSESMWCCKSFWLFLFTILYGMHIVNWVTSPRHTKWWSLPTVTRYLTNSSLPITLLSPPPSPLIAWFFKYATSNFVLTLRIFRLFLVKTKNVNKNSKFVWKISKTFYYQIDFALWETKDKVYLKLRKIIKFKYFFELKDFITFFKLQI